MPGDAHGETDRMWGIDPVELKGDDKLREFFIGRPRAKTCVVRCRCSKCNCLHMLCLCPTLAENHVHPA
jgi:hypothetical protein